MTRTASRILTVLLAVTASCCHLGAQEDTVKTADTKGTVHLDARDNGRRVEVQVGQRLTLELRANFSTGYSWQVVSPGEPVIDQLGEPSFTADSHRVGAGGTLHYELRAHQAGTAELKLVYVRPWEKGVRPADSFAVTVVVAE